jgi:hypothetical protein
MSGPISELNRTELHELAQDHRGKLARAEAGVETIKAEMAKRLEDVVAAVQRHRSSLGEIESEIRRREARDAIVPSISDHALLRYIERVHGVDVEALKVDLLSDKLVLAIKAGATGLKTSEGTFVIKGASVVTFLGTDMRPKRRSRKGVVDEDFDFDPTERYDEEFTNPADMADQGGGVSPGEATLARAETVAADPSRAANSSPAALDAASNDDFATIPHLGPVA